MNLYLDKVLNPFVKVTHLPAPVISATVNQTTEQVSKPT